MTYVLMYGGRILTAGTNQTKVVEYPAPRGIVCLVYCFWEGNLTETFRVLNGKVIK